MVDIDRILREIGKKLEQEHGFDMGKQSSRQRLFWYKLWGEDLPAAAGEWKGFSEVVIPWEGEEPGTYDLRTLVGHFVYYTQKGQPTPRDLEKVIDRELEGRALVLREYGKNRGRNLSEIEREILADEFWPYVGLWAKKEGLIEAVNSYKSTDQQGDY